ncbi:MAG: carboxypeptidase regulatory-like domain-containing protein [Bacteroidales bacterium]|nr:carboxypeptidase regulatory-like domain-containing protein [Bacteroidales bacterium]
MRKNIYLYGFLIVVCLFNLLKSIGQPNQTEFDNYITISNGQFWDGNSHFYPVCVNYLVEYLSDRSDPYSPAYYISPLLSYSNIKRYHYDTFRHGFPVDTSEHWGYGNDGATERDSAGIKLENDLRRMDSLGFNVVRLAPTAGWNGSFLYIPTGSYAKYFELTDSLIAKCARHNLRVILVLGDKAQCYDQFDQYCVYLDSVSRHYSNNKTVMAYVVYMEPGWKWENHHKNDKIMISNWSRKWYYTIKKNAPNQLVTYGLDGLNNVLFWDPSALTYDFLTMHFYYKSKDPDSSSMALHTSLKWMNENIDDVWVLGETGFSGTSIDTCLGDPLTGSEEDQLQYINFSIQMSVGCGCKGYAWWQYQDVGWGKCFGNNLGLLTRYREERFKSNYSPFLIFSSPYIPSYLCTRPGNYYNFYGYSYEKVHGVVKNENSNPIKDALVLGWSNSNKTKYSTFTNSQGEYTIYAPKDTAISLVWISQKGYTSPFFFHINNPLENTTLTRINYNGWKKNWTNHDYPIQGDNFVVRSPDTVVVGNFCGDEAQELLVVKPLSQTASLYSFHINHWGLIWAGIIGNWQIGNNDKFYACDFNGDGIDELLCIQNTFGNSWANIYHYDSQHPNSPWQYVWTNMGNGQIGNWNYAPGDVILSGHFNDSTYCSIICIRNQGHLKNALCQRLYSSSWTTYWTSTSLPNETYIGSWILGNQDKYYVGDFSGDGIDELLCVQATNGTSDKMTLMQYNASWSTLWSNNGISEGVDICPYRANLHVGNFDSDRADELLGINSWATKFDLNSSNQWNWSWSTYESGKLSDWAVNLEHHAFFMKTMTDVPDYLFVFRGNPRIDFKFDGYSFDP